MAPGGSSCMSLPRAATTERASSSEKTPARQAATYSPMLWPAKAAGRTPQCSQSSARAQETVKIRGWEEGRPSDRRGELGGVVRGQREEGPRVEPEERLEDLGAAVDGTAEDGLGTVEARRHARGLGSLPWEQEDDGRRPLGVRLEGSVRGTGQGRASLGCRRDGHGNAMREAPAPHV